MGKALGMSLVRTLTARKNFQKRMRESPNLVSILFPVVLKAASRHVPTEGEHEVFNYINTIVQQSASSSRALSFEWFRIEASAKRE